MINKSKILIQRWRKQYNREYLHFEVLYTVMIEFSYETDYKYAEVVAGHIYYLYTFGSGPIVVFLHAASGNSSLWEKQISQFNEHGYRIIAYDRVGHGRSTGSSEPASSETSELEQLLNFLGIDRFHLVGVAAGGGIALQYILGHPQRVLSLVLANSIGNVQDPEYIALGQRLRPPAFHDLPLEIRELGPSYRAACPAGVQRWLDLSKQGQSLQERGATIPSPIVSASVGTGESHVTFAALETLSIPVLLMTGDADLFTPPSVLRLFKQHIKTAEIAIVPESGHASYWENPEFFNRTVLNFLKSL